MSGKEKRLNTEGTENTEGHRGREKGRRAGLMFAMLQTASNTQHMWMIAGGMGIGFLVITGLVVFLMRKFFQSTREQQKEEFKTSSGPRTENPSAFMAASMQGVIQQLREQEKELERLHRIEKERAEQTRLN